MSNPFFSVIMPVYNSRETVDEALSSLRAQHFKDFEVIIIDDGSTDGSADWISVHYPEFQLIRQSNHGPAVARNAGLQRAGGKYVAFLDSDDLWFPWTLECYQHVLNQRGFPAVLLGHFRDFARTGELQNVEPGQVEIEWFDHFYATSRLPVLAGCGNLVIRCDHLERVNGFADARMNAEDSELLLRLGMAPGFVKLDQPDTVGYRRCPTSETQSRSGLQRTVVGISLMINRERQSLYPGGKELKGARRELICRHVRSASIACRRARLWREAFSLYWRSFGWQLALGRVRFIAGFWLVF